MILNIVKFCERLLRISPRIINSLRSYIKHSKECLFSKKKKKKNLFSNISKLVKKKKIGCASFFQPTSQCLKIGGNTLPRV